MTFLVWLADLAHDLRSGWRTHLRTPGASIATILVLGCGIGLSVAIFSVADVVLRRPLPIADEQRVIALWGEAGGSMRTMPLTVRHFERYRQEARAFVEVAGSVGLDAWPQAVRDGDRTFRAGLSPVTGNFFDVLASHAALGRMLRAADDHPGSAPVAVISYALWRSGFAGDPRVLGRRLQLTNGVVLTVIGVAPAGLDYPVGTGIWIPFSTFAVPEVMPVGRLRPGVSPAYAADELKASFHRESGTVWRGLTATAAPLRSVIVGNIRPVFLLLTMAAALVLLTACLNVSGLLLVRGVARRQDLAVRRALGAGRWRLLRQLIVENGSLAAVAALAGTWMSVQLVRTCIALAPSDVPRLDDVRAGGASLAVAALAGGVTVLVTTLLPAVWLSADAGLSLRGTGRTTTARRGTIAAQRAFIVLQVSVAVVVLCTAGVLVRSVQQLQAVQTGFRAEHVAILDLSWPEQKFNRPAEVAALYDRLVADITTVPGVLSAAPVNVSPFTGATGGWDGRFIGDGHPHAAPVFSMAVVGARYFQTLGITLRRGRTFDAADRGGTRLVAIVSERVASALWPGEDPLGRRIRFGDEGSEWRTVIGVAPETRYRALRQPAPTVYIPAAQFVDVLPLIRTIAVRTQGTPDALLPTLRRMVTHTDADVAVLDAAGMSELVSRQLATPRLSAALVSVFGAGILLLAAAGLYSVLAAVVRSRRRELAIRHVVGATPRDLRAIVLRQSFALCACGVLLGLTASFASSRYLRAVLYGVAANDPVTVASVVIVLFGMTALASHVPGRRATRADVAALLQED